MYVLDANVLIDYRDSDLEILSLFSRKIGPLFIPTPVADEVKGIPNKLLSTYHIAIYEPEMSELVIATAYKGGLSWRDYLCFLLAQKERWVCVTNEKLLRNECIRHSIHTIRGLRLMIDLCGKGHLQSQQAHQVALAIQKANSRHVTDAIIEDFLRQIN